MRRRTLTAMAALFSLLFLPGAGTGPVVMERPGDAGSLSMPGGPVAWMATWRVSLPLDGIVTSARYLLEGNRLLLATSAGEIVLYDIMGGKLLWKAAVQAAGGTPLITDISPDGGLFILIVVPDQRPSGTPARTLEVRDTRTGKVVRSAKERSRYYHECGGSVCDHRPVKQNLERRTKSGQEIWEMDPWWAQFSLDGSQVLSLWVNASRTEERCDRHYVLYNYPSMKAAWAWSVWTGGPHKSCGQGDTGLAGLFISRTGRMLTVSSRGAVCELDEQVIQKAMAIQNVCRHPVGAPLFSFTAGVVHQSPWMEFSQDDARALVTTHEDSGIKVRLLEMKGGKVLMESPVLSGGMAAQYTPADRLVIFVESDRLVLWDGAGKLQSCWPAAGVPEERAVFAVHPGRREIAALSGKNLFLIHERRPRTLVLKAGEYIPSGAFIRPGVDLFLRTGGPFRWKSGTRESEYRAAGPIAVFSSFGEKMALRLVPDETDRQGELLVSADADGEAVILGGLTKEEFSSLWGLRSRLKSW